MKERRTNSNVKSYIILFLIINIFSFIGGILDALTWIPYARNGGVGGFPVFSLLGICLGGIGGIIYVIVKAVRKKITEGHVIAHVIIAMSSITIPIINMIGLLMGWFIGYGIAKILM